MQPRFPSDFVRSPFNGPQRPFSNLQPPVFSPGATAPPAGVQFNGGSMQTGWQGPSPALGAPVCGFNLQSEVLGVPVTQFNGTTMNSQPWAGPRADSACFRDGGLPQQVGIHPFASSHPSGSGHQFFVTDQSGTMHNPMYQSRSNNPQQGGHGRLPAYGAPSLGHPQNNVCPYQNAPEGQPMKPFDMQQVGSSGHPEQQWPSQNTVNHIHTGVPLGKFSTNPAPVKAQQQWHSPEMANQLFTGIPARNPHIPSGRPSGTPQQCPLPDNLHPSANGLPAGNFCGNFPCGPTAPQHNCHLPDMPNQIFNGVPTGNFFGNPPFRPTGVPQQPSAQDTPNTLVNGIPVGNLPNIPLCGPNMMPMEDPHNEISLSTNGQNNPPQGYHVMNSGNTLSGCNRPYTPERPLDSGTASNKGQITRLPVDLPPSSICDLGKDSWGRGRGNRSGTLYAQGRGNVAWQGGRNSRSSMDPAGRGRGWRERTFSRGSGNRGGGMPSKSEASDDKFLTKRNLEAHRGSRLKYGECGHSFEASGKLTPDHIMRGKRAAQTLSKESEEEIRKWREERKRNYPTTRNIQRKAQEALARKMRGELEDGEARLRKERLKQILAKQAELGVLVAEIPAHYISDSKCNDFKGMQRKRHLEDQKIVNAKRGTSEAFKADCSPRSTGILEPSVTACGHGATDSNVQQPTDNSFAIVSESDCFFSNTGRATGIAPHVTSFNGTIGFSLKSDSGIKRDGFVPDERSDPWKVNRPCQYFRRGRCRKGTRCPFLHEKNGKRKRQLRKDHAGGKSWSPKREHTLLAKLLNAEIRKDKSHLLQCFRFFVNNEFLAEWPESPLKFFSWADVEPSSDLEEGLSAPKSPESCEFSDVDSEQELQSESSGLDESNLLTPLSNECKSGSNEDRLRSEIELNGIDSEILGTQVKHSALDDASIM